MTSALEGRVEVLAVPNGCICCSAADSLIESISHAVHNLQPDRLLIEPTGLAEPATLIDLIREDEIGERLDLRPIITLMHPHAFLRGRGRQSEIAVAQVEAANILVANFADQTQPEVMEEFYAWVGGLYPPKQQILVTQFGELPEALFDTPLSASLTSASSKATSKPHGTEGYVGLAWQWPIERQFQLEPLEQFFLQLAAGKWGQVVRAKGIFQTPQGWGKLEIGSSGGLEMSSTKHRLDSRCDLVLLRPEPNQRAALDTACEQCLVPNNK